MFSKEFLHYWHMSEKISFQKSEEKDNNYSKQSQKFSVIGSCKSKTEVMAVTVKIL